MSVDPNFNNRHISPTLQHDGKMTVYSDIFLAAATSQQQPPAASAGLVRYKILPWCR